MQISISLDIGHRGNYSLLRTLNSENEILKITQLITVKRIRKVKDLLMYILDNPSLNQKITIIVNLVNTVEVEEIIKMLMEAMHLKVTNINKEVN